jgi:uncharacterized membrane protein YdcZ (DUF606 family)
MVVKRFGVLSVAKVYGALTAAMGLLFGLILALASAVGLGLSEGNQPPFIAALFGVGAVVFLPVFYGLMGVVMGALSAALYNLFAGMVGGVKIEVE